jgi:Holliday junction resolvase RusA-like endonuclease
MVEMSKRVKPWRDAVVRQAKGKAMIHGPVEVDITFTLAKPLRVPKERNGYPSCPPDLDKLLRSTFDGLKTAGVFEDDSRVVGVRAKKRYQDGQDGRVGAVIKIRRIEA